MSSQDALPKVPPPPLRAPLLMKVLAVLSLLCGVFSALSALADLNGAMRLDRDEYIVRVRERQVSLHQQLQKEGVSGLAAVIRPTVEPFLRLPAPEIERLSGLLGDELYERQAVNVPLCLLSLLLSWLLLSGSLGVLRGQVWAVSMWSWACMVNMPFALLSMLVTFQHSRSLVSRLGPPAAEALAKVSGRPARARATEPAAAVTPVHQLASCDPRLVGPTARSDGAVPAALGRPPPQRPRLRVRRRPPTAARTWCPSTPSASFCPATAAGSASRPRRAARCSWLR
jgi:hypothetical protein